MRADVIGAIGASDAIRAIDARHSNLPWLLMSRGSDPFIFRPSRKYLRQVLLQVEVRLYATSENVMPRSIFGINRSDFISQPRGQRARPAFENRRAACA